MCSSDLAAWGLRPDVVTIGKAIAGGIPIGAYGVSAELSARIAALDEADLVDVGGVGGTLAGSALSLAAARATLFEVLTAEAFEEMFGLRERFVDGVQSVLADRGVPWSIVSLGARAELSFAPQPPRTGGASAALVRHRARGRDAPLPAQPRRDDHAVSQHGADVAGDDRGGRRPSHGGVRRGGRRARRPLSRHLRRG